MSAHNRFGLPVVEPTALDRLVGWVSPEAGLRRARARTMLALAGGYTGARRDRRATSEWRVPHGTADEVTLPDLPTLRDRSSELVRNAPLATGALNTVVTNTVGTGLKVQSRIDREVLDGVVGTTREAFAAWERAAEREFRLWAESPDCEVSRTLDFAGLQDLVLRAALERGDVFVLRRLVERPGRRLATALQVVEADRVANPGFKRDTPRLAGGVEMDALGAPVAYHVLAEDPGRAGHGFKTTPIPAFGSDGRRQVLHLFTRLRPGLTRGVPYFAPVIESLKQLDRYTEAEVMSAVVSAAFTVFVKTEDTEGLGPMAPASETGARKSDEDYKMGPGAILDLRPNESIEVADPKRPNDAFDPFIQAVLRQVGVALELPFELLVKHFTSSFTAAQASFIEAWKFFRARRRWLVSMVCQPVYEAVIAEAVARGRLTAPGFFSDPMLRAAYLGAEWIGPPRGQIRQDQEMVAAEKAVALGIRTRAEITAELTGGEWERKHEQLAVEQRLRERDGLAQSDAAAADNVAQNKDDSPAPRTAGDHDDEG